MAPVCSSASRPELAAMTSYPSWLENRLHEADVLRQVVHPKDASTHPCAPSRSASSAAICPGKSRTLMGFSM